MIADMEQSTCTYCEASVLWVAAEARWCASNNDHSLCPVSPDRRHHTDIRELTGWLVDGVIRR